MLDVRYNVQYVAANNYRFTLMTDENTEVDFACILDEKELSSEELMLESPALRLHRFRTLFLYPEP